MSSAQSIVVTHNGKAYENFSRLYIRLGLDEICQYLEMDASSPHAQAIHKHDTLKVSYVIDGFERLVATVRVDAISRLLNSNSQSYRISARSAARNIVDSSYSEQWRDLDSVVKLPLPIYRYSVFARRPRNDAAFLA